MPTFLFGIEKEAEIYCVSSKMGLAADPQTNRVVNQLTKTFIQDGKANLPMNEITDFIVYLCNENVLNQIDNRDDEQGVAWTIALLAKGYIAASSLPCSFDSLFKACFIKYYR